MSDRKCPVYVVYNKRGKVAGVYISHNQMIHDIQEQDLNGIIDIFDLKGNLARDKWDETIDFDCKYYSQKLDTIRIMIAALYEIEGCSCGGIGHIVFDDNNYQDNHLEFVIQECNKPENQDRQEIGLAKLICQELLKLSIQERALLFNGYYSYAICNNDCDNCPVSKGELDE